MWLNSADVLKYCFDQKFSFVFLYDPWPFPILPHLPSPLLQVTWVLPNILSSEPVTNVHEMNPDSKSYNSTQSSIDPVWQQDRSIQIDHSKTAYWSSWWEIWQDKRIDGRVRTLLPKHFKFQVPSCHQTTLKEDISSVNPPELRVGEVASEKIAMWIRKICKLLKCRL